MVSFVFSSRPLVCEWQAGVTILSILNISQSLVLSFKRQTKLISKLLTFSKDNSDQQAYFIDKLSALVREDSGRAAMSVNDFAEVICYLGSRLGVQWVGLYPTGKIICGSEYILIPSGCLWEGTNKVNANKFPQSRHLIWKLNNLLMYIVIIVIGTLPI